MSGFCFRLTTLQAKFGSVWRQHSACRSPLAAGLEAAHCVQHKTAGGFIIGRTRVQNSALSRILHRPNACSAAISYSLTSACSCGVIAALLACTAAAYVGCRAGLMQVVQITCAFPQGVWGSRGMLNRVGACRARAGTVVTGRKILTGGS